MQVSVNLACDWYDASSRWKKKKKREGRGASVSWVGDRHWQDDISNDGGRCYWRQWGTPPLLIYTSRRREGTRYNYSAARVGALSVLGVIALTLRAANDSITDLVPIPPDQPRSPPSHRTSTRLLRCRPLPSASPLCATSTRTNKHTHKHNITYITHTHIQTMLYDRCVSMCELFCLFMYRQLQLLRVCL